MALRLMALDVDLELEIDDPGDEGTAEVLLTMLPSTWQQAGRPYGAPALRLFFERGAGMVRLVEEVGHGSAPSPCPRGEGGRGVRVPRVLAIAREGAEPRLWLGRLEQEIVAAVARRSRLLWLHAGAVLWEDRALVLPGSSFAGKSTLADALVGRGARYLSDEWVAIDGRGRVHSLPRPLRLREGRPRPAVEVAGDWPLLATAFLRYHPAPADWPRRLAAADAVAELFPHVIGPGAQGGLAAVAAMLGRPVFAGRRGEARDFLDGWLGRLSAEQPDAA